MPEEQVNSCYPVLHLLFIYIYIIELEERYIDSENVFRT